MNSKQAAELSGVSSRNIRYYEQAGLLYPARDPENDYRKTAAAKHRREFTFAQDLPIPPATLRRRFWPGPKKPGQILSSPTRA